MLKNKSIYQEKGVDVKIALDVLKGALTNAYDICYIISSDTDLIPAIQGAKKANKKIIYVGFENFISKAMKNNCNQTIIITKDILKKC